MFTVLPELSHHMQVKTGCGDMSIIIPSQAFEQLFVVSGLLGPQGTEFCYTCESGRIKISRGGPAPVIKRGRGRPRKISDPLMAMN